MASQLNECLGGRAELVFDPAPTDGLRSPWRTYRLALERTPAAATHRLIVQDDVVVCDHFVEAAEQALAARPDRIVCFFVAGNPAIHARQVREACARGASWAELAPTTWLPVVATAWPVRLVEPMLAWVDEQNWPREMTADDENVGRYLRHVDEGALATTPSLVEHPDLTESLTKRRPGDGLDAGRRAALWIGDCGCCDGREIDWDID